MSHNLIIIYNKKAKIHLHNKKNNCIFQSLKFNNNQFKLKMLIYLIFKHLSKVYSLIRRKIHSLSRTQVPRVKPFNKMISQTIHFLMKFSQQLLESKSQKKIKKRITKSKCKINIKMKCNFKILQYLHKMKCQFKILLFLNKMNTKKKWNKKNEINKEKQKEIKKNIKTSHQLQSLKIRIPFPYLSKLFINFKNNFSIKEVHEMFSEHDPYVILDIYKQVGKNKEILILI